ncbi:50S ribosomal protein L25/general stress protein Ctc [Corynebacterium nuruki]|jgi:large subunit ribosomal protein L25|uniref:Large ribosomal subunit protein bL25 n=1 Tax=Corynebacterium nuruki TaxID=1032851 RepID=A0A3D4T0J8_9CORY|nr:50S ribosomal protein L25/general stress protein Ctc [Corynebacterium nuruki]HCT14797.1 50S ribosomal protein L25 [Corynebacterium nuruki]
MATKIIEIAAQPRTEFGKGAARRLRRAWRVPGVVYASHQEPVHVSFDLLEFQGIVRNHGVNALVDVDVDGEKYLAIIKSVDQNVLTFDIDHADLLAVKRDETVAVDVQVLVEGELEPGVEYIQDADTVTVEANVLNIPEELTVSLVGKQIGDQILASDVELPEGATLVSDPETLVVNFTAPEDNEAEADSAAAETGAGEAPAAAEAEEPAATEESAE